MIFKIIALLLTASCVPLGEQGKDICQFLTIKKINYCYTHGRYQRIWCAVIMDNDKRADLQAPLHIDERRKVCKRVLQH